MKTRAQALEDPRVRKFLEMKGVDVSKFDPAPGASPDDSPDDDGAVMDVGAKAEARAAKVAAGETTRRHRKGYLPPRSQEPAPSESRSSGDGLPRLRCGSCGAGADPADRWCPACGLLLASAPPREPDGPDPMPATSANGAAHAATGTPPRTCPKCGHAMCATRNRCYRCQPARKAPAPPPVPGPTEGPDAAGHAGAVMAPAGPLRDMGPAAAPPPRTAAPVPVPACGTEATAAPLDPEVAAIAGVLDALSGLDETQLRRVLGYLGSRFEVR